MAGWRVRDGGLDDPQVRALVSLHLASAHQTTPAHHVFALDDAGLRDASVSFHTLWDGDRLLGMGALKALGDGAGEVKSMRTHPDALRQGVAATLLGHIIAQARTRGYARLFLETGTHPAFAPAHAMYAAAGFVASGPFGTYRETPDNRFMMLTL